MEALPGDKRGKAHPPRSDLGVLFVHGIGEQRQGQTVVRFADAIGGWLVRWLTRGRQTMPAIGHSTGVDAVVFTDSLVKPTESSPAHTTMQVNADAASRLGGRTEWVLAESWWAECFDPPRTRTLLAWMLLVLPYMLLDQVSVPLRRSIRIARRKPEGWPRVVVFAVLFVAVLPLAGLVAVLLSLLLVPMIVPIAVVRNAAKAVMVRIGSYIGDAYVLTSSSVQFDAMVARVARDLAWLDEEAETTVLIAHSQGAAIAHEAISRYGAPKNLRLFVTIGQGLGKLLRLRAMQSANDRSLFWLSWLGVIGFYVVAVTLPQAIVSALTSQQNGDTVNSLLLGGGLVTFLACKHILGLRPALPAGVQDSDGKRLAWLDYYASADPVPNGPLLDDIRDRGPLREIEVWNRASVLTDHVRYSESRDDFLSCLVYHVAALLEQPTPAPDAYDLIERARWRGWWRVWWLSAARFLTFAATVSVVVMLRHQLRTIGLRVAASGWVPAFVLDGLRHALAPVRALLIVSGVTNRLLGGLAVTLGVAALAYLAIAGLWRLWEGEDIRRFFARGAPDADPSPLGGVQFAWFIEAVLVFVATAIAIDVEADYGFPWRLVHAHLQIGGGVALLLLLGPLLVGGYLAPYGRRAESSLRGRFSRGLTYLGTSLVAPGGVPPDREQPPETGTASAPA